MDEKKTPVRGKPDPAPHGQLVSFILTDRRPMYHRTIEGANIERAYLAAKTGKQFRLLKVISCSSAELASGRVVVLRDDEAAQIARDAERYRWLRSRDLDAVQRGGVFAGLTPENVVLNGDDLDSAIDQAMNAKPVRTCRVCGCIDARACPGGCSWVGTDLCSACEGDPK